MSDNDYARLRKKAIDGLVYELGHENIGIYPKSVTGGSKPYEQRSKWQEGWNACVMAHTEKSSAVEKWLHSIPAQYKMLVEDLLLQDKLSLGVREESACLWVDCSDTFYWGCSDVEEIQFDELDALTQCYTLSPAYGGELWCARKRGMRPQTASYEECYPFDEWSLFDAAGPVRDDSDGKREPSRERAEKWRKERRSNVE